VAPNPSDGIYQIIVNPSFNGYLDVIDGTGRTIRKEVIKGSRFVDLSNLNSGIYYFIISTENSNRVIRVIKKS
jgi:hypothetical protein